MGSIFSFFPGAQPISAALLAPGASVGEINIWLSHHVKDKKSSPIRSVSSRRSLPNLMLRPKSERFLRKLRGRTSKNTAETFCWYLMRSQLATFDQPNDEEMLMNDRDNVPAQSAANFEYQNSS
ncbi:unnamed protein product [Oikopleura dioica]|uniref:Uncharacterized protein n=1 Tax=Oikopleura dioica TaxID=34765 RepID=E4XCD7_OIKDI|nr:unnamed protein product [Oikopleura dioica]